MFSTIRLAAIAVLLGVSSPVLAGSDQEAVTAAVTMGTQSRAVSAADCMRPDLDAVIWLERHGEAQDMPGQQIFDKFVTVMRARAACRDGHVAEGLAMYDAILTTSTVGQGAANDRAGPR